MIEEWLKSRCANNYKTCMGLKENGIGICFECESINIPKTIPKRRNEKDV